METVRDYLLTVTSAALISGIAVGLLGKKDTLGAVIKMLAGIFVSLSVVGPWVNIRLDSLTDITDGFSLNASEAVDSGENSAREAMSKIIIEETRSYILDKAKELGAALTVEVTLNEADFPAPCAVKLSGNISPYGKQVLSEAIEKDLGIGTGEQTWIG